MSSLRRPSILASLQQAHVSTSLLSGRLAEELISPDAIFHVPGQAEPMRRPAGYRAIIGMMRGGIQWTLEELIAEDDKVAARFTMRGTHRGAFFGAPWIASANRSGACTLDWKRISG